MTLLLTRSDVLELLDGRSSIDAVEDAFRHHAAGATFGQSLLGTHVPGGGFHVKAAGLTGPPTRYAVKLNANFPGNRELWNLPTIQGVVILFDAANGIPLAVMDSMEVTALRTAAASAVAAKYLSRVDSKVLCIIGCGAQARSFLAAVGADSENKRELEPTLLAQSVVIVDSLEQCAAIGELHHALDARVMTVSDVRASLPEVVGGIQPGRLSDDEIIIFDSTGTAIQEVAAAALIYERARATGRGREIAFND